MSPGANQLLVRFGGDPFLSGEGAYETVMGVQSAGVQGKSILLLCAILAQ